MANSISLQSDISMPYLLPHGIDEQKEMILPQMLSGETIAVIVIIEPGAGSDLQGVRTNARRDGDESVIKGSKTFITNGQNADLTITVCKTDAKFRCQGHLAHPGRIRSGRFCPQAES